MGNTLQVNGHCRKDGGVVICAKDLYESLRGYNADIVFLGIRCGAKQLRAYAKLWKRERLIFSVSKRGDHQPKPCLCISDGERHQTRIIDGAWTHKANGAAVNLVINA